MKLRDVLVVILGAMEGTIQSKTKIQKLCYFLSIVLQMDFGFRAHYYGPYSQQIEAALDDLLGMGFVTATINKFGVVSGGFEIVRYDYSLTKDGNAMYEDIKSTPSSVEIINFINKLKTMEDIDYLKLSIAAKAYYVLNKEEQPMGKHKIREKAKHFNWDITDVDINSAISFLENIDLVRK
jgi:uncharacterized protein YwgA